MVRSGSLVGKLVTAVGAAMGLVFAVRVALGTLAAGQHRIIPRSLRAAVPPKPILN